MEARSSIAWRCRSIPAVLGKEWWPGRLIYRGHKYTPKGSDEERTLLQGLCPACGKWVPIHDGDMIDHQPPAGSDVTRLTKMQDAQEQYGRLVVKDAMRSVAVA
jgi:hypothetical protein